MNYSLFPNSCSWLDALAGYCKRFSSRKTGRAVSPLFPPNIFQGRLSCLPRQSLLFYRMERRKVHLQKKKGQELDLIPKRKHWKWLYRASQHNWILINYKDNNSPEKHYKGHHGTSVFSKHTSNMRINFLKGLVVYCLKGQREMHRTIYFLFLAF